MIAYTHVLYLGLALVLAGFGSALAPRTQRRFSTWVLGLGAATVALAMARLWGDSNGLVLASVIVLGTGALVHFERPRGQAGGGD